MNEKVNVWDSITWMPLRHRPFEERSWSWRRLVKSCRTGLHCLEIGSRIFKYPGWLVTRGTYTLITHSRETYHPTSTASTFYSPAQNGALCLSCLPGQSDDLLSSWPLALVSSESHAIIWSLVTHAIFRFLPEMSRTIKTGWWFGTCLVFHWECHHPNWRVVIFFG